MLRLSSEPKRRGPAPLPNKLERHRKAVRGYQQRQRERKAYMEALNNAATRLNEALKQTKSGQLCLPLSLVENDPLDTLCNVAAFAEAQLVAEQQNTRKARKKVAK
jgi:hypothetical protein